MLQRAAVDASAARPCVWVRAATTELSARAADGWILARALVGEGDSAEATLSIALSRALARDDGAAAPPRVELDPRIVWPAALPPCATCRLAPLRSSRRTAALLRASPRLVRAAVRMISGAPVALNSCIAITVSTAEPAIFRVVAAEAAHAVDAAVGACGETRRALRMADDTLLAITSEDDARAGSARPPPTAAELGLALCSLVGGVGDVAAELAQLVTNVRSLHARAGDARAGAAPPTSAAVDAAAATPLPFGALQPPFGALLTGGSGVGKTALLRALGARAQLYTVWISGSELLLGDGEATLRRHFARAAAHAPALVLIDDIEIVASKAPRGATGLHLCAQLASCLDAVAARGGVGVVAATARPREVHSELRFPGRLEIALPIQTLTAEGRAAVLAICMAPMRLVGGARDVAERRAALAQRTPGFTGADLRSLCQHAALAALARCPATDAESLARARVCDTDWRFALDTVRPAGLAQVLAAAGCGPPPIAPSRAPGLGARLEGGDRDARTAFEATTATIAGARAAFAALLFPLEQPRVFAAMGVRPPRGVLLHGPSGVGKTTLAHALGREIERIGRAHFIAVQCSRLLSCVVGESEMQVAAIFAQARELAPCVLFLDQVECVAARRSAEGERGGSRVGERVLSCLLTEMDGVRGSWEDDVASGKGAVVVLAATDRRDRLDDAILRPGRLDQQIEMHLPGAAERRAILTRYMGAMPIGDSPRGEGADALAAELVAATGGWSGAQLEDLCREAAMSALREDIAGTAVRRAHFGAALCAVRAPSGGGLELEEKP